MILQQRSKMQECRFLIPSQETGINYSKIVTEYLNLIKLDLGKTTGRIWFTGRNQTFVSSPMGKNTISKVIFYFHITIFSYYIIILYYYIYIYFYLYLSIGILIFVCNIGTFILLLTLIILRLLEKLQLS